MANGIARAFARVTGRMMLRSRGRDRDGIQRDDDDDDDDDFDVVVDDDDDDAMKTQRKGHGTIVCARDSGVVEIALGEFTSARILRIRERECARKHKESELDDGARRGGGRRKTTDDGGLDEEERAREKIKASARDLEELEEEKRERYVAVLYRESDDGKRKWVSLGRRAFAPRVEASDGTTTTTLVALFRDDERRRASEARKLSAAPKWVVPRDVDAAKTTFSLIFSVADDGARTTTTTDADAAKKELDVKFSLDGVKTRVIGEVRFTLMDLCANNRREMNVGVLSKSLKHEKSIGAVDVKRAEITLKLTPSDISRAWCARSAKSKFSKINRPRDETPSHALAFEALLESYEDAVADADAVIGLDARKARRAKMKSESSRARFDADEYEARARLSFRSRAVDDVLTLGDVARRPERAPNRASSRRKPLLGAS